MHHENLYKLVG